MTITYVLGKNLYINLTNRCPNACNFCLRAQGDGVGDADSLWLEREPTREEILADLQARNLKNYEEVVFCGYGEPTCRFDDLVWICQKIREFSPNTDIRLNTNGLADLINGRKTAEELNNLIDTISISLNAPNAERYEEICHSKFGLEAFPAILRFAMSASLYIPTVYMSIVDDGMKNEELVACERICERTGAKFRLRSYIKNNRTYD